MDASPDSQPNPRLHHHPSRYASPRSRRHQRRPRTYHKHRVRRWPACSESGDIFL
jgi:hypothetical protein